MAYLFGTECSMTSTQPDQGLLNEYQMRLSYGPTDRPWTAKIEALSYLAHFLKTRCADNYLEPQTAISSMFRFQNLLGQARIVGRAQ